MLFLVHMQESFRELMSRNMIKRVVELMSEHESWHFSADGDLFHYFGHEILKEFEPLLEGEVEWSWGYDPDSFPEEEKEWVIKSPYSDHNFTWVPEELRNWDRDRKVILVGGCVGSCLADMEAVLEHVGIDYDIDSAGVFY